MWWVLPCPYNDLPSDSFGRGRVLAAVWEKVPAAQVTTEFPKYLEAQGEPAELFDAWFELKAAPSADP